MDGILPIVDTPVVPGQATPTPPSGETLGEETFLRLLTEQLQNQDPLDPMKNEDFVAQLAQFSSLEQLFGLQQTMEAVYLGIASMNNAAMAGLLGTEVVAYGDTFHHDGEGAVDLHFDAGTSFTTGTITITDDSGTVVQTLDVGGQDAGEFTFAWDGTDLDGQPAESGNYSFSIDATDVDGNAVAIDTLVVGIVDEMDYSTGTPQPSIDGVAVPLEDIRMLTAGDEAP